MFIDTQKITYTWVKASPAIKNREELKKDAAREKWQKLIAQGWRRTEEDQTKKDSLGC